MAAASTESTTDYWQYLSRPEKIKHILNNGYLADCKFVVGPDDETAETILGHKIFYCLESPVFAKMFEDPNYVESQNSVIRITDVHPSNFKNLAYMIYNNCASSLSEFSMEETLELYLLCNKYQILSISQHCTNHVKNSKYLDEIAVEDMITLLKFTSDLMDKSLSEYCINHLRNTDYLKKISRDNLIAVFEYAHGLKDKSLLNLVGPVIQTRIQSPFPRSNALTEEAFYDYVKLLGERPIDNDSTYSCCYTELFLFSVINGYFVNNDLIKMLNNNQDHHQDNNEDDNKKFKIETNNERRKKVQQLLQNLLKLLNWDMMSSSDFKNGPGKSKILTYEQKYKIVSLLECDCKKHRRTY